MNNSLTKTKIFIDGREGTTGLRIYERVESRPELELTVLPEELRKDTAARAAAINSADVVFLCLPDAAAVEAVALCTNPKTVIIDASTVHRTLPGWAYGFPELSPPHRAAITGSKRIAVPGCHAGGFIAIAYPLVKTGVLPADYRFVCHSLTGYSGGGKAMIADYKSPERHAFLSAPRQYGLTQTHKHLREMTAITGLINPPLFCPIVADFYSGMEVTVPIICEKGADFVRDTLSEYYKGAKLLHVLTKEDNAHFGGFLPANALSGADDMYIFVGGDGERVIISALFDNLGKGASGAAVQCMNIALGLDEAAGLSV